MSTCWFFVSQESVKSTVKDLSARPEFRVCPERECIIRLVPIKSKQYNSCILRKKLYFIEGFTIVEYRTL